MNPLTPVGAQAANPMTVRVLQSDGVTPVSGATVGWSGTNGLQLSACGGLSACSVLTDQYGQASTWLIRSATGNANIGATLAPGVYSPSKSANASLVASESSSDIGLLSQYFWVLQGSNAAVPLKARVLSNGVPQANAKVNFTIVNGSGSLSAASAQTSSGGYATVTLNLTQFATPLQATACVAPANAPCLTFYGQPVSPAALKLQPVAGARADFYATGIPAGGGPRHRFFCASESRARRVGHIPDNRLAARRNFARRGKWRHEHVQSRDACDPQGKPSERS